MRSHISKRGTRRSGHNVSIREEAILKGKKEAAKGWKEIGVSGRGVDTRNISYPEGDQ
jgi:hypothetical protein